MTDQQTLARVWARLDTPIEPVRDASGAQSAGAQMRRDTERGGWLYGDDVTGYSRLSDTDALKLLGLHEYAAGPGDARPGVLLTYYGEPVVSVWPLRDEHTRHTALVVPPGIVAYDRGHGGPFVRLYVETRGVLAEVTAPLSRLFVSLPSVSLPFVVAQPEEATHV